MDDLSFGQWLQRRRRSLLLTQAEVADQAHCSAAAIRKVEADERRPSAAIAEHLARVLNIPAAQHVAFVRFARGESRRFTLQETAPSLPLPQPAAPRSNVPAPLTSLIGREHEVLEVSRLVQRPDVRLVTLTGVGGTGKTRLAIAAAAVLQLHFPDRICWIPLAPLTDATQVLPAIAQGLGVSTAGEQPLLDTLIDVLRAEPLLLLLDNFEHVLAAATAVAELLAACPELRVLATSRAPLRLAGEHMFVVPPLDLPDPDAADALEKVTQSEAGALFIARATAARRDVPITETTAPAVAAICVRLDGLPLAIELAAARSTVLAPDALLARLVQRLDLLTGGARDAPKRQQTLRATIDWSYQLLTAAQQRLFARLGVFVGGWTLDAAEAICAAPDDGVLAVLDGLHALVEQQLVRHDAEYGGISRYRMLETLRDYARERLAAASDREVVERRHVEYYLALAETAEEGTQGPEQVAWLDRLEHEQGNLRTAFFWAQARDEAELCLRLAAAQQSYWLRRGQLSQGIRTLEAALALQGTVAPRVRATALLAVSSLVTGGGTVPRVEEYRAEALALFEAAGDLRGVAYALMVLERTDEALALFEQLGDKRGRALAHWILAHHAWVSDLALVETHLTQAHALFRELGHTARVSHLLAELGGLARDQGNYARAEALLAEGLELSRQVRDHGLVAWNIHSSGELAMMQGQYAAARSRLEQSLGMFRRQGNDDGIMYGLYNLGFVAQHQGDAVRMAECLRESVQRMRQTPYDEIYGIGIAGMAAVAAVQGRLRRAARLFGAAEAQQTLYPHGALAHRHEIDRNIAAVRAQLDQETWCEWWTQGQSLTLEQALAEALEETGYG